ncbi:MULTISPECIES: mechanosensitive ion channel family protein [Petrimonas]|jgi:small conductance mechanosensitive channel|uniref:Small-conductance mechanosensitive channel n=1 Tax=Petrimonas mucosa TaxID=1642646 RepID=A0A1G4G6T6_9BACT|nr:MULTISPECIES: mechanosensitive ion channel domain-containing protein [Petrimonas]MDD3560163.1 mechanosensitive ion channel [Petrimonas mucosa]SCM57468.1 Small-conductance mechanosensitive channel [Petrimonas mucosa]HHT29145.1 mechanosensitive ion channel [Petrimonas mucosa]
MLLTTFISVDSTVVKTGGKVAEMIRDGRFEELGERSITWGIEFLGKLAIALLIFFVGKWIIGKIRKFADRIMSRRQMDIALKGFLKNLIEIFLFTLLIILIINIVGSQTVSLAALIASVGLAVGLAVKDNLANFAGGVMLLFNKPFKGGDYIEAQNLAGTVQSVGILYTTLTTADNKTIYIPNGPLSTGNILNYSTQTTRRVEVTTSIEYGTDAEVVKKMLLEIADRHPKVLKNPAPFARMTKMNDDAIDFTLRVWVESSDYWNVTYDLNEEIYKEVNARGLVIPYRQMTVHLANSTEQTAN